MREEDGGLTDDGLPLHPEGAESPERLERLRIALETTDAIVWDWDLDTDRVIFIPPPETLYDATIETVDDFFEQVYHEDRDRVESAIENALEGDGTYAVEFRTRTDSGLRWVSDRGRVQYDETGTPMGMTGVAQDITTRKRYQHLVQHVLRHNIRNQMSIITGSLDSLDGQDRAALPGDRIADIEAAAAELEHLGETATKLSEIIRPAGETRAVDLAAIVDSLTTDLSEQHPGSDLVVETPGETMVRTDHRLRYVLSEAIENAIVHTDCPTVEVRVVPSSPVRIEIADDGAGIPELELEALDEDTPITSICHSEGLGLAVIKWGMDAIEGDLSIRASDTDGTRITIELPAADGTGGTQLSDAA